MGTISGGGDPNLSVEEEIRHLKYVGEKIPIQVKNCENYEGYGNSWYRHEGMQIHIHIGIKGLTTNNSTVIAQIPVELSPENSIICVGVGGDLLDRATAHISSGGKISVASESHYLMVDVYYLSGGIYEQHLWGE